MTEIITSLQNSKVKLAHQLQNRARTRRKERKIVLEGTRLIGDATQQRLQADYVLYEPSTINYELLAQLQELATLLLPVSPEIIRYVSDTENPQGILGVYPLPVPQLPKSPQRMLVLDAIREPGNMGTILRTAAAAAVQVIILAPACVDPYNPKVLRAGMGAHFRIPIVEATWSEIADYTEETNRFLAAGEGTTGYTEADWLNPWVLMIGNEAHGVSDEAHQLESTSITIPMAAATESLNAAVAAGVILFEAQRQYLAAKE